MYDIIHYDIMYINFFGGDMGNFCHAFRLLSKKFIYLLSIIILFIISIFNISHSTLTYSSWYPLIFRNNLYKTGLLFILSFFFVVCLYYFVKNINEKSVFLSIVLFNIISLIVKVVIILSFNNSPIADSWDIFNGVNTLLFTSDKGTLYIGNYFAMYPQQLGMVSILSPLAFLFKWDINAYYYFQAFLIQLTIALLTLCSFKLKGLKVSLVTTILLNLFIPNLFVPFLIYGDLYSYFFIALLYTLYLYTKNCESKYTKVLIVFVSLILISLAYLARISTVVFIIAFFIVYFINRKLNIKYFVILALTLIFVTNVYPINTNLYNKGDVGLGEYEFPSNTWIRLGVSYSWFDQVTPGFHDQRIDWDFKSVGYNKSKMSKINHEVISARLNQMFRTKEWIHFYKKKIVILWTDPDFEMMSYIAPFKGEHLSDPSELQKVELHGSGATNLKANNIIGEMIQKYYYPLRDFEKLYLYATLFIGFLVFVNRKDESDEKLFIRLLLIGFFALHLLIEIKSRYIFVFYSSFIFIISLNFYEEFEKFLNLMQKIKSNTNIRLGDKK